MSKKRLLRIFRSKALKRSLSTVTALVLFFGALPMLEISEELSNFSLSNAVVSAAEEEHSEADEPQAKFRKVEGTKEVRIKPSELVDYSIAANMYHKYHQDDVLVIKPEASNDNSGTAVMSMNFRPLGTEKYPFRGEVQIGALSGIVLNIDGPLFNYVYDSAVVSSKEALKISRYYSSAASDDNKKTPLIANHVVHDAEAEYTEDNPRPVWNIEVVPPSVGSYSLQQFGGFIGKMWKNYSGASPASSTTGSAELTVSVTMNKTASDTNDIPIKGTGDLGLACNIMDQGTKLDFTMSSDRKLTEISTSSGNVGGLVGSMAKGASFKYTGPSMLDANKEIKTDASGYAGGVVGKNDGGEVTLPDGAYTINQYIQGTNGAGGIYGYYNPQASSAVTVDLTAQTFSINCHVKGNGSCGGLYGKLESNQKVTINTNDVCLKSNHSAGGTNAVYGGLIGTYNGGASVNELIITSTANQITVQTTNAGGSKFYGGGVGRLDPAKPTYVKFDNFTVNSAANANGLTFGGLVASADNAFVDADTVKVAVSNDGFKGGGLVGSLDHGVLRMNGKIDLSGAKPVGPGDSDDTTKFGQIVGYRDDAIVYAEKGWTFNRYSSACEVDDIGGWGEVIRFDGAKITAVSDLFTVDETTHVLTVNKPSGTDNHYTNINNEADFAKTALCMQIDAVKAAEGDEEGTDNNYFIAFEDTDFNWDTLSSQVITVKSNIVLTGSGFTGLTRDNDVDGSGNKLTFSGRLTSAGDDAPYTVTLAVGEAYGNGITGHDIEGRGKIYRHLYNGLIGIASSADISNIKFGGSVNVKARKDTMYVGAVAAMATVNPIVSDVTVDTAFGYAGANKLSLGGIFGEADSNIEAILISDSIVNCNITGSNSSKELYLGGAVGYINRDSDNASTWSFTDVTVTGTISNSQSVDNNRMGGLVAAIAPIGGHDAVSRAMNLNTVNINGLAMTAAGGKTIGGALGYSWYDVNVNFDGVKVQKNGSTNTTITLSATGGDTAGLVYAGTGHWTVEDAGDVEINGLTVAASSAKSFGGFVNKAWYNGNTGNNYKTGDSSALYLELKSVGAYKIGTGVTFPSAGVYDEIAAYSAYYREDDNGRYAYPSGDSDNLYVLQNGAAVISIKTDVEPSATPAKGLNMDNGATASHSYVPQTTAGNNPNPYTRYYYNLDRLADDSSNAAKLMLWGLRQYAHPSLTDCFGNPGTMFANATTEYDMEGYSWYPVDIDNSVIVRGIFKFYNKEFEGSENKSFTVEGANGTHTYFRTSLYDSTKSSTTQHYLMQNGLFRNVNAGKTLTVGTITLQGNVGKTPYGSGALICGRVQGGQDNNAKVDVTGTIELDRVYVHDISLDNSEYAPLAINKVGDHSNLTISAKTIVLNGANNEEICYFVMDENDYPGLSMDGSYPKAGTSLVGNVGLSASPVGIILDFSNMVLDGRSSDVKDSNGDTSAENEEFDYVYGSQRSIFTKATLLNSFKYESGSFGKYNFTWDEDWKQIRIGRVLVTPHEITYGKELGYRSTNSGSTSEYPDKELWYSGEDHTTGKYTNPDDNADTTGWYSQNFIDGFLPYVYTSYNEDNKTHQLMVNQKSAEFSGCGTYNDPYIINSGDDLVSVSKILNQTHTAGFKLSIPKKDKKNYTLTGTWHINKDDKNNEVGHVTFEYKAKKTETRTTSTQATDENGNPAVDGNGDPIYETEEYTYPAGYYLNGTYADNNGTDNANYLTTKSVEAYLAGAYYKIGSVENITIESNSGFKGLGYNGTSTTDINHAYFRGVFIGDNKEIINETKEPFIASSNGCVIKDLTVKVAHTDNISFAGSNATFDKNVSAYGGLIRRVFGGDTIIDNVLVDYSGFKKKITATGTNAQLAPIGGYIGVIVNGGVIFRNISDERAAAIKTKGLTNGKVTASGSYPAGISSTIGNMLDSDNFAWLYVNPIIGRVINGFAVNESGAYRPFEDGVREYGDGTKVYYTETKDSNGNVTSSSFNGTESNKVGVTLKNGTKNYSITDISSGEDSLDTYYDSKDNNIGVPNGQAFFIMSLMVNSGIRNSILGYSTSATNYQIKRWAEYTDVKTNTSQTTAPATGDYSVAKDDKVPRYGYLAKAYTTNVGKKDKISGTITLTDKGGTYYLPDGYKGIGNLFEDNSNLRMSVSAFNGNGVTISQNTSYYYYENLSSYFPITSLSGGLGLINYCDSAGTYDKFYLTGNVKTDIVNNTTGAFHTGKKASELDPDAKGNKYLCAGMLFGTYNSKNDVTVKNVALKNVDVFGIRNTGGLVGFFNGSKTLNYTIETTVAENEYNSDKIKVHGRASTGGLIGKINTGYVKADMNNHTFNLSEVESKCEDRGGKYYDYGVGGFIGMIRAGESSADLNANYFKNIIIGTEDKAQTVKCEKADIFTAGVVGIMNKSKGITIDNCIFYNLSVSAKFAAAGLVAFPTTWTPAKVTNTHLYSPLGSTIESTTDFAGGLIGSSDPRSGTANGSQKFTFENCSVEGYTISGKKGAGGVIGFRGAVDENYPVEINNTMISKCTINSDGSAGGLIGEMNQPIIGYNILAKDILFGPYTNNGSITNKGFICGSITTKSENVTYKTDGGASDKTNIRTDGKPNIKIAGFSRQATSLSTMEPELVGSCNYGDGYGTGGYVIFADYDDTASVTSPRKWFSNVKYNNSGTTYSNVTSMRSVSTVTKTGEEGSSTVYGAYDSNDDANTASGHTTTQTSNGVTTTMVTVNENYPFVTNNPWQMIDSTNILTGDAMGEYKTTFASSTFNKIYGERNTSNKGYKNIPEITSTGDNNDWDYLKNHYSTSTKEFINKEDVEEFPLLVVEDTDGDKVTNLINNYIGVLTNTKLNYADTDANKAIYNLALRRMRYSDGKFEDSTGDTDDAKASLRCDEKKFYMNPAYVDTDATPQFTLVDVQFYDPSTITWSGSTPIITKAEVAYHLYVPVYVKKLLKYDFYASLASNSDYYKNAYKLEGGFFKANYLFENLGNTVTLAMEYNYTRTPSEWIDALNSGENVLVESNFYKSIYLKPLNKANTVTSWPAVTRMVLVDSTRNGKNYYLDAPPESDNLLHFNSFTEQPGGQGEHYKPAPFNNLLTIITVQDDEKGTFVRTSSSDDATFEDKYGEFYKLKDSKATYPEGTHFYKIDSVEAKPERYYLTIFTKKPATGDADYSKVFYYEINSKDKFERTDTGSGNDVIASSNWRPNSIDHTNAHVYLLMGNLYENTFDLKVKSKTTDELMSAVNNYLEVTMTSTIKLTDTAVTSRAAEVMGGVQAGEAGIYQTFLATYDMLAAGAESKIGIDRSAVSLFGQKYDILPGAINADDFTATVDSSIIKPEDATADETKYAQFLLENDNYLEMRNNQNLIPYLSNSTNEYAVTMQATVGLLYNDKTLPNQFPQKGKSETADIGTRVIGYSNISSSVEGAAYSATSEKQTGAKRYYIEDSASATLSYNMVEKTTVDTTGMTAQEAALARQKLDKELADGQYRSLGINAKTDEQGFILSRAEYDTSMLASSNDYDYVELTLTLSDKDSYVHPVSGNPVGDGTPLKIDDYLTGLKIYGKNDTVIFDQSTAGTGADAANVKTTVNGAGTLYTVRVKKNLLETRGDVSDGRFIFELEYAVKTGDGTGENKWNKKYSNYKVSLTAELCEALEAAEGSTDEKLTPSYAYDHLIYTNAKVETNVI